MISLPRPAVSIVIPAHNDWPVLVNCLNSIRQYGPACRHETVVVVNGSTDGTLEGLQSDFPSVHIIANPVNRGMASALNQAIAATSGQFVLCLDSDNVLRHGYVDRLVATLRRAPQIGAACGQRVNPDGSHQVTQVPFPTLWQELAVQSHGAALLTPFVRRKGANAIPVGGMLLGRTAIDAVGGFDEAFLAGYQDVDLCMRLVEKGFEIHFDATVTLMHDIFHQGKSDLEWRRVAGLCDMVRYYRKHGHSWDPLLAVIIHYVWLLPNVALYMLLLLLRPRRSSLYRFALRAELQLLHPSGVARILGSLRAGMNRWGAARKQAGPPTREGLRE